MQPSEIYSNEEHRMGENSMLNDEPTFDQVMDQQEKEHRDHAIQVGWGIGKNEEGELAGVVSLVVDNVPIEMASSRAYELGMILISTGEIANTVSAVMNVAEGYEALDLQLFMNDILEILRPK